VLAGSGSDPAGRVAYVRTVQPGSDAFHPGVHPGIDAVTSSDVSHDAGQHTVVISADINTVSSLSSTLSVMNFTMHRLYALCKMRPVATDIARSVVCMSVCLSVCWAHWLAVQKRMN